MTKPILFSTEMVEAISEGIKTQTRRIKKGDNPQFQTGDILWVRETWAEFGNGFIYKADSFQEHKDIGVKWRPSIHMPKKAARIFLEVTNVRCERLQDISEGDAIAEGLTRDTCMYLNFRKIPMYKDFRNKNNFCDDARSSFMTLWINTYSEQNWNENPFVWVYEFKFIDEIKYGTNALLL